MHELIWLIPLLPLAGFLLIAGAAVAAASPGVAEKAAGLLGQAPGPTSTTSPSPEDTDGAEDKNDDTDSDATTDGDKHDAARILGISYRTLQRRVKQFDLEGYPKYR